MPKRHLADGAFLFGAPAELTLEPLVGAFPRARRVDSEAELHRLIPLQQWTAIFVSQRLGVSALAAVATRAASQAAAIPVIALGAEATPQEAVDAMQQGAADYLPEGASAEQAVAHVAALLARRPAVVEEHAPVTGLVGSSPPMQRIATTLAKISRYRTNVLVLGESGTGKELVARALHAGGPHRAHLFVPLNCATLGRDILENELFGHERGAFTGANERKQGLFELADGGTLFLDEIGEMDVATQAKLLRVLERNEFRRVGGTQKVKVDLSVVAATHRDLERDVEAGKFREDLYYRLKVVTVVVPPLRERREDIPELVKVFVEEFNRRNGGQIRGVTPGALRLLMEHPWPGNVRQLKNAIESAAVLATGERIDEDTLVDQLAGRTAQRRRPPMEGAITLTVGTALAEAEKALILATVQKAPSRAEAARMLGVGLRTLYTKLRDYGLDGPLPKRHPPTPQ